MNVAKNNLAIGGLWLFSKGQCDSTGFGVVIEIPNTE